MAMAEFHPLYVLFRSNSPNPWCDLTENGSAVGAAQNGKLLLVHIGP